MAGARAQATGGAERTKRTPGPWKVAEDKLGSTQIGDAVKYAVWSNGALHEGALPVLAGPDQPAFESSALSPFDIRPEIVADHGDRACRAELEALDRAGVERGARLAGNHGALTGGEFKRRHKGS